CRRSLALARRGQLHAVEPCRPPSGPSYRRHDALRMTPVTPVHALHTDRQQVIRARYEDTFGEATGLERRVDALGRLRFARTADRGPQRIEDRKEVGGHSPCEAQEGIDPTDHDEAVPERAALEEPLGQTKRRLLPEASDRERRLARQRQRNGVRN